MEALVLGILLGLGVIFIFDALVRPEAKPNLRAMVARLGPRSAGAIAGSVVAFVGSGARWPVAAVAGALFGWWLPAAISSSRLDRLRLERVEALSEVAARLRDSIRSGAGLQEALAHSARHAPKALAPELNRLVVDLKVAGPATACANFSRSINDPAADLLSAALSVSERVGPRNMSELLDSLAESTTGRAAALREARARQTQNRLSARIVAAMPVILLVAIRHSNPAYLEPLGTPGGQVILSIALALIACGYALMLRMARIDGT